MLYFKGIVKKGVMSIFYQKLGETFRATNITFDLSIEHDNNVFTVDLMVNIPNSTFSLNCGDVECFYYTLHADNPTFFSEQLHSIEENEWGGTVGVAREIINIINREITVFYAKKRNVHTIKPLKTYL